MLPLMLVLITLPLSWAGTALVIRLARRRGYLAAVNARSSHRQPTPQGAGWAVMGALLPVWAGVGADRRAEQQAERRAVADDEVEVGGEALLDPVAAGLGAARRFGEHLEQTADPVSSSTATKSARLDGKCW